MQPLTKVMQGATCTVKWALGLPETVEKLRELKIEQGSKLQVVCKNSDYMIIGVGSKRYAVGNEIAGRIQVQIIIKAKSFEHIYSKLSFILNTYMCLAKLFTPCNQLIILYIDQDRIFCINPIAQD